jgi:hypothetical protein
MYRKNLRYFYELIYFNDNTSFSHENGNYLRIIDHINTKYKYNVLVVDICNIYKQFIENHNSFHHLSKPTFSYEFHDLTMQYIDGKTPEGHSSSILPAYSEMHDIDGKVKTPDIDDEVTTAERDSSFYDITMEKKYIKYKLKYLLLKKSIKKT